MMDRRHVYVAVSLLFFVLLACKSGEPERTQASATASAAATPTPTPTTTAIATQAASATAIATASASAAPATSGPSNAADITRFPDEKKLDEKATLEWSSSKIRKKPQGDMVVSLPKGTSVTKIAERQGFFLIVFADPKDASKQVEGWVFKDAFSPEAAGGQMEVSAGPGNKCPAGTVFREDAATGKHCNKVCSTNAQCTSGWVCYSGACMSAQGE